MFVACSRQAHNVGPEVSPAAGRQPEFSSLADREGDGTPDFLRLNGDDAAAFRQWFTFLAEVQYYRSDLPREIDDCAALIRYACREALSRHDDAWAARVKLPLLPPYP